MTGLLTIRHEYQPDSHTEMVMAELEAPNYVVEEPAAVSHSAAILAADSDALSGVHTGAHDDAVPPVTSTTPVPGTTLHYPENVLPHQAVQS